MQLFVKSIFGEIVTIEVTQTTTIIEIKEKISEKLGVDAIHQKLICQGIELYGNIRTVQDFGIKDEAIINIVERLRGGMEIFAKTMDGKTVAIEVQPSDTILNIKERIREQTGLQVEEQKLVYKGSILENGKTVADYGICDKDDINIVIRLRGGMQIFARTADGRTVAIEVQPSDTILNIKEKIKEKTGICVDGQTLEYQGIHLEDDKTVAYYQIGANAVINVE